MLMVPECGEVQIRANRKRLNGRLNTSCLKFGFKKQRLNRPKLKSIVWLFGFWFCLFVAFVYVPIWILQESKCEWDVSYVCCFIFYFNRFQCFFFVHSMYNSRCSNECVWKYDADVEMCETEWTCLCWNKWAMMAIATASSVLLGIHSHSHAPTHRIGMESEQASIRYNNSKQERRNAYT